MRELVQRIALGTAQFGLQYGVANRTGQVGLEEATAILSEGRIAGLDTLDTAIAYGNSEERLGQVGVTQWRVVTKLPGVPDYCPDIGRWVRECVAGSLKRLGLDRVHGLLLHRPREILGRDGKALGEALHAVKEAGMVERVGISIYAPDELDELGQQFTLDLVQAPFNVVDRRLATSGWLTRLKDSGVEVHTRSTFLQGLLLMTSRDRPQRFGRWQSLWDGWEAWLAGEGVTALEACVGFVLHTSGIDRMVVGVDNRHQLRNILQAADSFSGSIPARLASDDQDLINPSNWNSL